MSRNNHDSMEDQIEMPPLPRDGSSENRSLLTMAGQSEQSSRLLAYRSQLFEDGSSSDSQHSSRIAIMDFLNPGELPCMKQVNLHQENAILPMRCLSHIDEVGIFNDVRDFEQCLFARPSPQHRIIFMEGIATAARELLFSVYNLDGEFFHQHSTDEYDDPSSWNTSHIERTFFGLRWCHPIRMVDRVLLDFANPGPGPTPKRRIRIFGNTRGWRRNRQTLPTVATVDDWGGVDEQVSVYFVPKARPVTVIILTDGRPLHPLQPPGKGPVEPYNWSSERPMDPLDRFTTGEYPTGYWTLDAIWDAILRSAQPDGEGPQFEPLPQFIAPVLLDIAQRDCLKILWLWRKAAQNIRATARDRDATARSLQDNHWSRCFSDITESAPMLHRAIDTLRMVCTVSDSPHVPSFALGSLIAFKIDGELDTPDTKRLRVLKEMVRRDEDVVNEARQGLNWGFNIIETRRQLQEAAAVKRLTELAFLFIPLSFSTSIFGMEMTEFQDGVPLYWWVVTASALVVGAYALRFLISTEWMKACKRGYIHWSIRVKYDKSGRIGPIPLDASASDLLLAPIRHQFLYHSRYTTLSIILAIAAICVLWAPPGIEYQTRVAWTSFCALYLAVLLWRDLQSLFRRDARIMMPISACLAGTPCWVLPLAWVKFELPLAARIAWTIAASFLFLVGTHDIYDMAILMREFEFKNLPPRMLQPQLRYRTRAWELVR